MGVEPRRSDGRTLLVVDHTSNRLMPLPEQGTLLIGLEGDIALAAPGVVPDHARLRVTRERVLIEPVAGPVSVNEQVLSGKHELWPGDQVRIGDANLTFRDNRAPSHKVLGADAFHDRLKEELERSSRRREPLAVLLFLWSGPPAANAIAQVVTQLVRLVDVVGVLDTSSIGVVLPGTGQAFEVPARRVAKVLADQVREVRVGAAVAPVEGLDAGSLVGAARFAARHARPGQVLRAMETVRRIPLGSETILIGDPVMHELFGLVERVARSDLSVLICGETGTGKELIAMALHHLSSRCDGPFVPVNCAAIADNLFESELFGHEKGAFTDAKASKPGLIEAANGGTLFLDEVGELSPPAQAKLLRAIEQRHVRPLGSVKDRVVDVRVVAASNRDLRAEVEAQRFRRDLFFRLNGAMIHVPPLRERPLDIALLAMEFLGSKAAMSEEAMRRLHLHDWPGNVRELRNLVQFCAATAKGSTIDAGDIPPEVGAKTAPWLVIAHRPAPQPISLRDEIRQIERARILEALVAAEGVRVEAAQRLGIPLRTLTARIREYGIQVPSSRKRSKD